MDVSIFSTSSFIGTLTIFFIVIVALVFYIMGKMQIISILKRRVSYLEKTLRDLDQQTKLIIKSDMELKLQQQEIEDTLNKLTLIKDIITSSVQALDQEKLLSSINQKALSYLGFTKGLLLKFKDLELITKIGFADNEVDTIINILKYKQEVIKEVRLLPESSELYKRLSDELQTKDILVAPIKARKHAYAIFIASTPRLHTGIKKSEMEAFLIISMYLGQCFDNIRLFEDLYHTKDELEHRMKERTVELVKSLRKIEVINKAKSDFISSVSHELRTPLTSVKGFSSLLVDEKFGKLPEEAKKRLEKIDNNVNKLMAIVNTLLDISRIESGKMEVKIGPFEIIRLIKEVTDFLAPQIEAKKLILTFDTPQNLNVYMDRTLIERTIINLVNNAIKFTPKKGKIKITCVEEGTKATISITDTGCGMKSEDVEKVFQEFFRSSTPESANIEGSGLGLSLVKRIIDTHKEKIWVTSEPGKGSTFSFTLKTVKNV